MTKVLSSHELDQASIDESIKRLPFNPHEKTSVEIQRRVMALMYGDGYLACKEAAHADYRALEEQAAKDAVDAERWRWLVAENNKGGSRAKFLICWWSKGGDGYESTTGTSVNGHDPETIVRLIDKARTPKEQTK